MAARKKPVKARPKLERAAATVVDASATQDVGDPRRWIFVLAVVALLTAAGLWAHAHPHTVNAHEIELWLEAWIGELGAWAPVVFVLVYAAGTVFLLPGSIFDAAGGILFGPLWGSAFNLAGAVLGATCAFLISRYFAAGWVARIGSNRLNRVMRGVEENGWQFVAFVRLVPIFPYNIFNYLLGLTRIPLLSYVLASAVFMVPATVAYTWLGHVGREMLVGKGRSIGLVLLALAVLLVVAVVPRVVARLRGKKP
jgi:uncharacterized membrane protein YdjX (TVP38/TMEM64 family)